MLETRAGVLSGTQNLGKRQDEPVDLYASSIIKPFGYRSIIIVIIIIIMEKRRSSDVVKWMKEGMHDPYTPDLVSRLPWGMPCAQGNEWPVEEEDEEEEGDIKHCRISVWLPAVLPAMIWSGQLNRRRLPSGQWSLVINIIMLLLCYYW